MSKYKLVVVVRSDLKLTRGRMAAQVAHAAINAYRRIRQRDLPTLTNWIEDGGTLIVLKARNETVIQRMAYEAVVACKIPVTPFYDDKINKREASTLTCMAFGPAESERIDAITGKLPTW